MELMLAPQIVLDEENSLYEPRKYIHFKDTIREDRLHFNGGIVLVTQHPRYESFDRIQICKYVRQEGWDRDKLTHYIGIIKWLTKSANFNHTLALQLKIGEYTLIPGFIDIEGSKSLSDFGGRKLTLIRSPITKKDRGSLEKLVMERGFRGEIKYWESWYFQ